MTRPVPAISVVVPTRDRPAALARCLASLAQQDVSPDAFEILVVDDGSSPPVTVDAAATTPVCLRVVRQEHAGPAAARNRGVQHARGTFVAFTDDDCVADRAWLRTLMAALTANPDAGVGGHVANALVGNAWSEASQLLIGFLYGYYNHDPISARFFTSNNLAFPRRGLVDSGGFDPFYQRAAAEDRELCDRWTATGRRLIYVATARVAHAHAMTFRSFWRQHYRYGRGAWGFRQARARRGAGPVRIEPLAFYWGLVTYPLKRRGPAGVRLAARLVLAQLANAVGFLSEACRAQTGGQASSRRVPS
jgi:GT2 family glycosyltransferase